MSRRGSPVGHRGSFSLERAGPGATDRVEHTMVASDPHFCTEVEWGRWGLESRA